MTELNQSYETATKEPSAANFSALKAAYLNAMTGLSPEDRKKVESAKSPLEVGALFNSTLDGGMHIRFRVRTLFRHESDDDDDDIQKKKPEAEKKDEDEPEELELTTPFGDCGYSFQAGETYLVYANNEEASDRYFTGSCTRTRRLSEAGDDLAYLFFYKQQREESARLEAFVTTNASNQLDFDSLHDPGTIKDPVAGAVVELRSDSLVRFVESDSNGRTVFDGLAEGDYRVSAFARGYPSNSQVLSRSETIHIGKMSCARQFLLTPASTRTDVK